ncbi:MAG: hypothetical protein FWC21_05900 [Treponema sp.]|nr:hypothetical protein [Treponema sp.]
MKKTILIILTVFILIFCACSDPILHLVSNEIEIKEPLISGSPTNFAALKGKIYVAGGQLINEKKKEYSHRLFEYTPGDGKWDTHDPNGIIISLAASNDYLYAIFDINGTGVLKRTNDLKTWIQVGDKENAQAVYFVNNHIFLCVKNINDYFYEIFYSGESSMILNEVGITMANTAFLNGVIFDGANYYICTNGGIYITSDPGVEPKIISGAVKTDYEDFFMGIIKVENAIASIARNGKLFEISSDAISEIASLNSGENIRFQVTSALAAYKNNKGSFLLFGIQDSAPSASSGFTYGYMEIKYNTQITEGIAWSLSGAIAGNQLSKPGSAGSLIDEASDTYDSTIGVNPIHDLFQAPDGILFASTQKNGVWSYREREDGNGGKTWQWNSEQK